MRIVSVCSDPGIPVYGTKGASVHVQELVRAYRRLGHDVTVLAARQGGAPPSDLREVEVVELGRAQGADTAARELAAMTIDDRTEAVLEQLGPIDLVHERYSLWGGAGIRHARRHGTAGVLEVNAPLVDEQARHRELVHREVAVDRLRETARAATAITAVSEPVATWVRTLVPESADAVHVLPNGVDTDRIRPPDAADTAEAASPRAFTVGFVGNLRPWHGVDTLVDAVGHLRAVLPEVRLLLVGDGPQRPALEAAAHAAGVEMACTGRIPAAEVPAHLHRMDVACAPYPPGDEAAYFSPLKVLEYLAAGLPVVASRTGQLSELLDDGCCGVLVPAGDPTALASALHELAADPTRRAELGTAARAKAVAEHRWVTVAARTIRLADTRRLATSGARR